MREANVTIFIKDDGTVDLAKFGEVDELKPVKELIDRINRENGTRRRENERLSEQVTTLEREAEEAKASATSATEALKSSQATLKTTTEERDSFKEKLTGYEALGSVEELTGQREDAGYGRERRTADRITKAAQDAKLNASAVLALNGVRDWQIEYREVTTKHPLTGAEQKEQVPFRVQEGKDPVPFRDEVLREYAPLASSLTATTPTNPTPTQTQTLTRPDPVQVPQTDPSAAAPINSLLAGLQEVYGT